MPRSERQPRLHPSQSQPVRHPSIRDKVQHFLRQVEARHIRTPSSSPVILHYLCDPPALGEWSWPCDTLTGECIPPDQLQEHRRTHKFLAPCCLCALIEGEIYTESSICLVESLPMPHADRERNSAMLHGEYVATCAKGACGYFVCLERFYTLHGIRVREYPGRATPLNIEEVAIRRTIDDSFRNGDALFQVMPNILRRGSRMGLKTEDLTQALDKRGCLLTEFMMGIEERKFWSLFIQCHLCKTVMLREPFSVFHQCAQTGGRFTLKAPWIPQNGLINQGATVCEHIDTDTNTNADTDTDTDTDRDTDTNDDADGQDHVSERASVEPDEAVANL
ncbi:hypothetical protein DFP72DRAFT_1124388 [Ephemerocybe angulata]|uniref:Uncharacterized protein n=1 Tax=Ephemerocybe angulata TaxID=980116 RepID=A0A8H6M3W8_9AGAR|nr:hypothetical protein DFP72DRAFT_1124388 [Tulosesus angulatus]